MKFSKDFFQIDDMRLLYDKSENLLEVSAPYETYLDDEQIDTMIDFLKEIKTRIKEANND